jgi:hypothetical protein
MRRAFIQCIVAPLFILWFMFCALLEVLFGKPKIPPFEDLT